MYHLRRSAIAVAVIATVAFITWFVPKVLVPNPPSPEDQARDRAWVDTSPFWLDRQACRWFSVCGIHHMRWDDPVEPRAPLVPDAERGELELKRRALTLSSSSHWEDLRGARQASAAGTASDSILHDVPDYVLRNAPLVHLYSGESFWPADIGEHVQHMTPYVKDTPVNTTEPLSLANLYGLAAVPGMVYLTSKENVELRPGWLSSQVGKPSPFHDVDDGGRDSRAANPAADQPPPNEPQMTSYSEGTTWFDVDRDHPLLRITDPRERLFAPADMQAKRARRAVLSHDDDDDDDAQKPLPPPPTTPGHKPDASGYSAAPAILVLVDKGSGILDAFWFFFYSYNLGQTVLNMRFGNHVGDWEHCMVRFEHGVPRAMFLSEHEGGQAYAWSALEKKRVNYTAVAEANNPRGPQPATEIIERPVIYSAVGSHAMYAFAGPHAYVLPFQMLKDDTDRGPLWDPALNNYAYFYDYTDAPPPDDEDEGNMHTDIDDNNNDDDNELVTILDLPQPTSLTPASKNPHAPTSWFHFDGPWGDELYGLGDERQWRLFGQYHYVTGPMGPKFKRLGREKVCQKDKCRILGSIEEGRKGSWHD
ncbi:hypothetical protein BD289DRAFT_470121 [Coniella lustricola]|uniref:Vacuolar protein sorting-associated protein n=1 Tax=Coniella lustricola TaxID=2025994 RepID=A0A2T2ZT89_9PEZI|nr:hypothetical protein BD289DRAFT_470121 [Coniella lustricola]